MNLYSLTKTKDTVHLPLDWLQCEFTDDTVASLYSSLKEVVLDKPITVVLASPEWYKKHWGVPVAPDTGGHLLLCVCRESAALYQRAFLARYEEIDCDVITEKQYERLNNE